MDPAPHLDPDCRAASVPRYDAVAPIAAAPSVSVADAGGGTAAAPPHLLWQTLESAYAAAEESPIDPGERPLPAYIVLPVVLGLSLVLWVVIVELVLMH